MRNIITATAGAVAAVICGAGAAQASVTPAATTPVTATTHVTDHPDSGNHGDWATDDFTRTVTVRRISQVGPENCPGTDTGFCYLWRAKMDDSGTFTTIPGDLSPRGGVPLDVALTGSFSGGSSTIQYYSSWKTAKASRVPGTVSGPVSGRRTTTNWVEQFYGPAAVFNSGANPGGPNLGHWSWKYTANFGSDPQCPNNASQWIDGWNNSDGSLPADGDILASNSSNC